MTRTDAAYLKYLRHMAELGAKPNVIMTFGEFEIAVEKYDEYMEDSNETNNIR